VRETPSNSCWSLTIYWKCSFSLHLFFLWSIARIKSMVLLNTMLNKLNIRLYNMGFRMLLWHVTNTESVGRALAICFICCAQIVILVVGERSEQIGLDFHTKLERIYFECCDLYLIVLFTMIQVRTWYWIQMIYCYRYCFI